MLVILETDHKGASLFHVTQMKKVSVLYHWVPNMQAAALQLLALPCRCQKIEGELSCKLACVELTLDLNLVLIPKCMADVSKDGRMMHWTCEGKSLSFVWHGSTRQAREEVAQCILKLYEQGRKI